MRLGRQRQPHRVRHDLGSRDASGISAIDTKGKSLPHQHKGAAGSHARDRVLPNQSWDLKFPNRQQVSGIRNKQVENKVRHHAAPSVATLRVGRTQQSEDHSHLHTHVSERHRRQALPQEKHNGGGQGRDDPPPTLPQNNHEKRQMEDAPSRPKRLITRLPRAATPSLAGPLVPRGRPDTAGIRAALPDEDGKAENPLHLSQSEQNPASAEHDIAATDNRASDRAVLAGSAVVPPTRDDAGQPANNPMPISSETLESKEAIHAALGMDFIDALRIEERKNNIPKAASFEIRLSQGTQERYANGWKKLREMVHQSPNILQEIKENCSKAKILAHLLAKLAENLQKEEKSASSYAMAASAVSHYLQAAQPTAESILKNTGKGYRRLHPSAARNDTVPNVHKILDIVQELFHKKGEKAQRDHLALLLMLLSGRRAADTVRIWRHHHSLRFQVVTLDAPGWARAHRSEAYEILRDSRWISNNGDSLGDREFIQVSFRAYLGKTCQTTGTRCDPWVTLTENRSCLYLCPILAISRYLRQTAKFPVSKELRYDSHTVITHITDPAGKGKFKVPPLLLSANGKTRSGLQSSTLRSRIKKVILIPLGLTHTPHALRACVTSYKAAYKVPINIVKQCGNWNAQESFEKHYFRITPTPVHPHRVRDAMLHDWMLVRAHQLSKLNLPPLDPDDIPDTSNDHAIAQAYSKNSNAPTRQSRRRRG